MSAHTPDDHDLGLQHDLLTMATQLRARRSVLGMVFGGGAAAVVAGCGGGGSSSSGGTTTAPSTDASLSAVALSAISLSPAFSASTYTYTATARSNLSSLTITPSATVTGGSIKVNGTTVASGAAFALNLADGANTATVVATAPDGTTTRTYTVTITRIAAANDAGLSALTVSAGTLSPAFAAGTASYAVSVANGVSSTTVTPTAIVAGAMISVNGTAVASGSASAALPLVVGANAITVIVTATDGTTSLTYTTTVTRASAAAAACVAERQATNGPYPSDGSNMANGTVSNTLLTSGVVRSDIRSSFGGIGTATATGVPVTLNITLQNSNNACAPIVGAAIYIWHCTDNGLYSLYTLTGQNYLRGVQVTDANGLVSFQTIFPGCYSGRYPHIHFEVYTNLTLATINSQASLTSQIALPRDVCTTVYAGGGSGYSASINNLAAVQLGTDNVFNTFSAAQQAAATPSMTGSIAAGYVGAVTIGVPL
jgi:protocatechuate 3,4-dioxygenase beta subunit